MMIPSMVNAGGMDAHGASLLCVFVLFLPVLPFGQLLFHLVGKIQETYGISKDEVEKQLTEWQNRQKEHAHAKQ